MMASLTPLALQVMTKLGVSFHHFVAEVVEVIAATFPLQRSQLTSPTSVPSIQYIDLILSK